MAHAAKKLEHKGFLLEEDVLRFIDEAQASNVPKGFMRHRYFSPRLGLAPG